MARKQNDNTTPAEQVQPEAQTTSTEQTTTKAAAKVKTPEQQAAGLRRQAGELRRSAEHLSGDAKDQLINRATQMEQDADAISPRKSGKSNEPRPTCKGTKKDGSPCTAKAMEGSEYCTDHRPVRARFTDAEWAAFGRIDQSVLIDRLGWGVALKMAKELLQQEASVAEFHAETVSA